MKWIKPFEIIPESENKHEPCFSLQDMVDCFYYGHTVKDYKGMADYFKDKFNIDINETASNGVGEVKGV